MARNGVIGNAQGLPWRLPEDLRFFMRTTARKPVIMGRKTFETMKAPLPRRLNIIVTRDASYAREGISVATSLDAALEIARVYCAAQGLDELIVAGGSEIYRQALPLAQRLYVTTVAAEPSGDTVFPDVDWSAWERCWYREFTALDAHDHDFSIAQWRRRA